MDNSDNHVRIYELVGPDLYNSSRILGATTSNLIIFPSNSGLFLRVWEDKECPGMNDPGRLFEVGDLVYSVVEGPNVTNYYPERAEDCQPVSRVKVIPYGLVSPIIANFSSALNEYNARTTQILEEGRGPGFILYMAAYICGHTDALDPLELRQIILDEHEIEEKLKDLTRPSLEKMVCESVFS